MTKSVRDSTVQFARPVRAPGLQGRALGQAPVGRVPSRGALGGFNSLLMQNPGSNVLTLLTLLTF